MSPPKKKPAKKKPGARVDPPSSFKLSPEDAILWDLRVRDGLSFRDIAEKMDRAVSTVHERMDRILRDMVPAREVESARSEEIARLDSLETRVREIAMGTDDDMALKAVDRLVRLADRRARLLGLDLQNEDNANPALPTGSVDEAILALVNQQKE